MNRWLPVLLIGCLFSCKEKKKVVEKLEILPVMQLKTFDTSIFRNYVADIQAVQNVEIRNRVPGFLEKILVDEGQQVRKGQVLFQIEAKQYQQDVTGSRASLSIAVADSKSAELELERVKLLVSKNIITPTELKVAQAKLDAAYARIRELQSGLSNKQTQASYTTIYAPFDGIINRIPLKTGSLLSEGDLLTTISDISSVYSYFDVSENEYLNFLKTKRKLNGENDIRLTMANGSRYPYSGTIETVEGQFDENTGSIAFRAKFPNPDKTLRHGSTGTIQLPMEIDSALLLPQKSVIEIQDKNYVYILGAGNRLRMQPFQPQTRFSQFYVVKSGLKAGDKILYEGTQDARDGMIIQPNMVSEDSLLSGNL